MNPPTVHARQISVTNVFSDINRGGAAITAETVRASYLAADTVVAITVEDLPDQMTHGHTIRAFPDLRLLGPALRVRKGLLGGLEAFLRSIVYLAFPNSRYVPSSLRALRSSSLVISKGGHVFVNRTGRALLAQWCTTFPVLYALRQGVPVVTAPTSVGPFDNWWSRELNRYTLRRLACVVTRDPLSTRCALELGLPADRVAELPDIAFSMPAPTVSDVNQAAQSYGLGVGRFIAMTVRLPTSGPERTLLKQALVFAANTAMEHPTVDKVALVVQANDFTDTLEIADLLGESAVVISDNLAPDELVALYGGARLTVACRLHSAIFSAISGTPPLAVSLDGTKTEGVFASLGIPKGWVYRLDTTILAELSRNVHILLHSDHRQHVMELASKAQAKASAFPDIISREATAL